MLNEITIKNLKAQERTYKVTDGNGLTLVIHKNGSKYWRLRYYFAGKEKMLALGVYPSISLKEARDKSYEARKLISQGKDPSVIKKIGKVAQGDTFEIIAREWHNKQKARWVAKHAGIILRRLELNVFPLIGSAPISKITAPELLTTLRKVEGRNALETAKRLRQTCGQIFRYAIATGKAERDIATDLRDALEVHSPENYRHLSAEELPKFLKALDEYNGSAFTKLALKIVIYTFVRTGEIIGARWEEVDLDNALWTIPASRMKMRLKHLVPLSTQTISLFKELKSYKQSEFIFPASQNPLKHMSNCTMLGAIKRINYNDRTTVHGFRATASTILNEHGFNRDHIERQLAHTEGNKVRAAYNYAEYLPERKVMMQWWGDYLWE